MGLHLKPPSDRTRHHCHMLANPCGRTNCHDRRQLAPTLFACFRTSDTSQFNLGVSEGGSVPTVRAVVEWGVKVVLREGVLNNQKAFTTHPSNVTARLDSTPTHDNIKEGGHTIGLSRIGCKSQTRRGRF